MTNLEIKVHISNSEEIRKKVSLIETKFVGMLQQVDTYFITGASRLKIREEKDKSYFVYYKRPNVSDSKLSKYFIFNIPVNFSKVTKEIMSFIFGVKVVVNKKRDLFMYKNTRIHLDRVNNLGEFIELETVFTKNIQEDELKKEHSFVVESLGLSNLKTNKESYSDLMLLLLNKQL